ncbi:hypothetical protein BCR44DRAFT_1434102 [Catenaria anguillulae PL171]|uniref:BTB domain-containing protein n=1 Tax=Catenaria anguillulae PL171 TaxID=765915 RepID=A0A1Y2HNV7_9FUNG|nr:hypothetical protein BCR44DRAFT_1434102 [Catenaria anguillulae PL171]
MGTTKWPQCTLMTFQVELSHHSYRRRPSSTGTQDTCPTLGPTSKAVQDPKKGTVVTSTFAFPDNYSDARWAIKQLSVTVDCVYDLVLPVGQTSSQSRSGSRISPSFSSALNLVDCINDTGLSDCRLQFQDGSTIAACKLVLAHASPFFMTMFKEPQWTAAAASGSAPEPIPFDSWSIKAFIPCLIHMYTGWVPYHGDLPRPDAITEVIVKNDVDPGKYSLTEWLEVLQLAEMIELSDLVKGVKRAMVGLLEE